MLVESPNLGMIIPRDQVLSLTSLIDRLPGRLWVVIQDVFRIQAWILDHCCCRTFDLDVFMLCPFLLGSALCCDFGFLCVCEAFCCQVYYSCGMFMCQTHECRPNEGAPLFFFFFF